MIDDIRNLPHGTTIDADVCVIGAGAAGIAIAREFISSVHEVVLLESGGYHAESDSQQLYEGESIGEKYYSRLDQCRTRRLGGSTNCWGAICTPLSPVDFEKRPWVPWSGWPLTFEEISPYMMRAHAICGAGPFLYDGEAWEAIGLRPRDFAASRFDPFVWHFNTRAGVPVSFGRRFRGELRRASNIRVYLHANVTALTTCESGSAIESAKVRTLEGGSYSVRARVFILACGGIENARVLLASDGTFPNGLGNNRDMVGRFFHEHLQAPCGLLIANPEGNAARYSSLSKLGATACLPGLALARSAQAEHKTLNGSIGVDPFHGEDSPWPALERVRSDLRARTFGNRTLRQLWKVARNCSRLAPEAWQRVVHGARPGGARDRFVVYARAEQAPNPASRVVLTRATDALGMRCAALDWHTTPLDRKTIRVMARYAATEFQRLRLGTMIPANWLASDDWPEDLVGGPHHMGATRMSDDPWCGVVDRNCQVHDVSGLYVAGSSIFPTGGHANPTLSIIAFAVRLADHIRVELSKALSGAADPAPRQAIPSEQPAESLSLLNSELRAGLNTRLRPSGGPGD